MTQDELDTQLLTSLIERTFAAAYALGAQGMSQDALLIDFDIQACVNDDPHCIKKCQRDTIIVAASAVKDNIPFVVAHDMLMSNVRKTVAELLAQNALDEN